MWLTEIYYNLSTHEVPVLGACLSIYRTGLKFYGHWDRIGFYKKMILHQLKIHILPVSYYITCFVDGKSIEFADSSECK